MNLKKRTPIFLSLFTILRNSTCTCTKVFRRCESVTPNKNSEFTAVTVTVALVR